MIADKKKFQGDKTKLMFENLIFPQRDFFCWWCRGVVVITTARLHSTKPELRIRAGSNSARGVSEIRDGEDL